MSENDVPTEAVERDCAVCLQKCNYPTKLPCGHIFCFLCVKGVAIQNKRCALCRDVIPADYLNHPVVLEKLPSLEHNTDDSEYHWYYEGRNGWWKYDERSNMELENAYSAGDPSCRLLLAGAVYSVDFTSMLQVRSRDPTRRRRVRRDTNALPAKGIAGIKMEQNINPNEINNDEDAVDDTNQSVSNSQDSAPAQVDDTNQSVSNSQDSAPAPVLNIDHAPDSLEHSGQYNPLSDIVQRISTIDLTDDEEDIYVVSDADEDFLQIGPEENTTDT